MWVWPAEIRKMRNILGKRRNILSCKHYHWRRAVTVAQSERISCKMREEKLLHLIGQHRRVKERTVLLMGSKLGSGVGYVKSFCSVTKEQHSSRMSSERPTNRTLGSAGHALPLITLSTSSCYLIASVDTVQDSSCITVWSTVAVLYFSTLTLVNVVWKQGPSNVHILSVHSDCQV